MAEVPRTGLLDQVTPDGKHHTTVMRPYCWPHQANHLIPVADVERIMYALAARVPEALWYGLEGDRTQVEQDATDGPPCLLSVLTLSQCEYLSDVEQAITSRRVAMVTEEADHA